MTKKSDTPAIRFKGFTDTWEQRKVSELFRVTRGYVLAATQTETTKTDEKPYPVYSSQTKDKGLMGYYKDYLYEDAITWTTDGANAGTVNYRAGKFYCTNVCGVLLSNEVKANQMIAEALNSVAKGYVSYVGNPKLMNNVMADIVIQIPTQAEEREQLSSFFAKLDNLITLHQRKYDKLTNVKKSMLEKMFPKNGSNVPEIRFKGFTEAWEQRKLTEFVEFFSGLTYTPNDVQENGTLVLRSSNVSNGEVVDADNIYVNPQVVNSENVKVGDIVVVVRNGSRSLIGKHAQIKAFMPNTVIGAFMTGIRSECPEFTNALLNTSRFEEEIAINMGATINQITGYMFSKMEFKVPCLDEQKKIGEYFEKLDNLITLHQRELEKLKNIKKSCLENMFV
ncbi:restriction endonuclease subunit S [Ruminococcus bromii]|uniref:restriction endonuclease subunit S n=1 Tax=Ruminococcus bromii TaxID=40518 RepID=UPI00292D00D4|nr:restriction endonuclease subunit S [Ruminococcus bromii]MDE8727623.1 restriction endonuclease subunit S [Ruminococcus bromii]